jgi:hypothetical protein
LPVPFERDEANRTYTELLAVPLLCRVGVSLSDLVSSSRSWRSRLFGSSKGEVGPTLLSYFLSPINPLFFGKLDSNLSRWLRPAMKATEAIHAILPRQTLASASARAGEVHPLTTIIPIPTSCLDRQYSVLTTGGASTTYWVDYWRSHSECWPPDFTIIPKFTKTQLYSPGVCPSGYIPHSQYWNYNAEPTTYAFCCPRSVYQPPCEPYYGSH